MIVNERLSLSYRLKDHTFCFFFVFRDFIMYRKVGGLYFTVISYSLRLEHCKLISQDRVSHESKLSISQSHLLLGVVSRKLLSQTIRLGLCVLFFCAVVGVPRFFFLLAGHALVVVILFIYFIDSMLDSCS